MKVTLQNSPSAKRTRTVWEERVSRKDCFCSLDKNGNMMKGNFLKLQASHFDYLIFQERFLHSEN